MEKPDYLGLSGAQLQILVTIHSAGNLSLAAKMLDLNQSTLSYWLGQLRDRFDDPLFVRVGQGMQPTERMTQMIGPLKSILKQLQSITEPTGYDPAKDAGTFSIACSALERDLIVHPLVKAAVHEAPHLTFEIRALGSGFQVADRLRNHDLDLAFFPDVLSGHEDLLQRVLFPVQDIVFFDPDHPLEEGDLDAYHARPHARIAMGPDAEFDLDRRLAKAGQTRRVGLQVPDFDTLAQMILGTPLVATLPSHMRHCSFCRLDWVKAPWPNDRLNMAMFWQARNQGSIRHRYWRQKASDLTKLIPK